MCYIQNIDMHRGFEGSGEGRGGKRQGRSGGQFLQVTSLTSVSTKGNRSSSGDDEGCGARSSLAAQQTRSKHHGTRYCLLKTICHYIPGSAHHVWQLGSAAAAGGRQLGSAVAAGGQHWCCLPVPGPAAAAAHVHPEPAQPAAALMHASYKPVSNVQALPHVHVHLLCACTLSFSRKQAAKAT